MAVLNNLMTGSTDYDVVLQACKDALSQSGGGGS